MDFKRLSFLPRVVVGSLSSSASVHVRKANKTSETIPLRSLTYWFHADWTVCTTVVRSICLNCKVKFRISNSDIRNLPPFNSNGGGHHDHNTTAEGSPVGS